MNSSHWNTKNIVRLFSIIGAVSGMVTLVASIMSGWLIFKLVRYLKAAQKALPRLEKAAALYIENQEKHSQEPEINSDDIPF